MNTTDLSRRDFLKGAGALIVSFNLFPSFSPAFAQSTVGPGIDADPTSLDSWLAVAPDGTITVFSGKVDLGTGVETALAQIVAEELDVPFSRIHMIGLDTTKAIDQGITAGRRIRRARHPGINSLREKNCLEKPCAKSRAIRRLSIFAKICRAFL